MSDEPTEPGFPVPTREDVTRAERCPRCGCSGRHTTRCPAATAPFLKALSAAVKLAKGLGLGREDVLRAVRQMYDGK